jgi:group I intron endonuclease
MEGNIYIVINKINNKKYIGQTINPVNKRMVGHYYDDSLLCRAFKKYGKENFIIKEFNNIRYEWMDWAEQELIQYYNSVAPNGYNLHLGGQYNRLVSYDTKQKISISNKGRLSPNKNKKLSKECKEKISNKLKGNIPWNKGIPMREESKIKMINSNIGRKCSEETKSKMSESAKKVIHTKEHNRKVSESLKGKKNKKVICIETNIIYNSIKEAQQILHCSQISACCMGKRKTSAKFHWEYYIEGGK